MELPPQEQRQPQAEQPYLTDRQQAILDCTVCFTVNGSEIGTADFQTCREGTDVQTAGLALRQLRALGLVERASEAYRHAKFRSTGPGISAASSDLDPWNCKVGTGVPKLSSAAQEALGCLSCRGQIDLTTTIKDVAECRGRPEVTARYGLQSLVVHGLAERAKVSKTLQYSLTDQAATKVPESEVCQRVKDAEQLDSTTPLTEVQKIALDCMRCQVSQGLQIDRARITRCTEIPSQSVRKAARKLIERGLIEATADGKKPGLFSYNRAQNYRVVDVTKIKPKYREDCPRVATEINTVYERLGEGRRAILGCLACISDQLQEGVKFPGANYSIIERCSDFAADYDDFMRQLLEAGYVNKLVGYVGSEYRQPFYELSLTGKLLAARLRQDEPDFNTECKTPPISEITDVPIHAREAVIKCLGCKWTQQALDGQPYQATRKDIASCSGISPGHLGDVIFPAMLAEGNLSASRDKASRRLLYRPGSELRPLFGVAADCNSLARSFTSEDAWTLEPLSGELVQVESSELEMIHDFEAFYQSLDDNPQIQDLSYEMISNIVALYPLLTAKEAYLGQIIQYSTNPQKVDQATVKLIYSNVRLARWMAARRIYERKASSIEDMTQAALGGIVRAARGFNPQFGFKYSTYAYKIMLSEMHCSLSDLSGVPRNTLAKLPKFSWLNSRFVADNGRPPSIGEMALLLGATPRHVQALIDMEKQLFQSRVSLENRLPDGKMGVNQALIKVQDVDMQLVEVNDIFSQVSSRAGLSELERELLELVIVKQELSMQQYIEMRADKHNARTYEYAYNRVMSHIRHPFFGLGPLLGSVELAWQEEAFCRQQDYDGVLTGKNKKESEKICEECVVKQQCNDFAMNASPKVVTGIWAGKTRRGFSVDKQP